MPQETGLGRIRPVASARMVKIPANGPPSAHYSAERIPRWQLRRRLKLWAHVRLLETEFNAALAHGCQTPADFEEFFNG